MSILEVSGIRKVYSSRFGGNFVEALKNVSFQVERGEFVAIMGESGSGKTTLLNILAALDKPTAGKVLLDGMDISKIRDSALAQFRRDNLGFVFQDFNLLDTFTLEDNIYLHALYGDAKPPEADSDKAGHSGAYEKISLRGVGRAEAARGRRKGDDHKPQAYFGRRADGSFGFALLRRAFEAVFRGERPGADRFDGHPFDSFYQKIADTLTLIATGGERA